MGGLDVELSAGDGEREPLIGLLDPGDVEPVSPPHGLVRESLQVGPNPGQRIVEDPEPGELRMSGVTDGLPREDSNDSRQQATNPCLSRYSGCSDQILIKPPG